MVSATTQAAMRRALLAWYDAHARDLPWRRTRDPYAIWVSEIMLQQTRVDTVIPYYERFLSRFPSVQALADAPRDTVLAAWSGLGYYRRARMLHEAAEVIARDHAGNIPRDPVQRLALPGVGRYTAGAIGSIAYDLPEPIVDGNVARVLSRIHGIDTPLGKPDTERALWEHAAALAKGPRPGALNQALMELGATVCTPDNARCGACPWQKRCRAHAEGRVDALPVPAKAKAPSSVKLVALVSTTRDGRIWLLRSEESLFFGLWGVPLASGTSPADAQQLRDSYALDATSPLQKLGRVKHVLTHRILNVEVFGMRSESTAHRALKAVPTTGLADLGVSKLTHKILALTSEDDLPLFRAVQGARGARR